MGRGASAGGRGGGRDGDGTGTDDKYYDEKKSAEMLIKIFFLFKL